MYTIRTMNIDQIIVIITISMIILIISMAICYGMYMRMEEQREKEEHTIDIREFSNVIIVNKSHKIKEEDFKKHDLV